MRGVLTWALGLLFYIVSVVGLDYVTCSLDLNDALAIAFKKKISAAYSSK